MQQLKVYLPLPNSPNDPGTSPLILPFMGSSKPEGIWMGLKVKATGQSMHIEHQLCVRHVLSRLHTLSRSTFSDHL